MGNIEKQINQRAALLHATGKAPSSNAAWQKADIEMEAAVNLYQSQNVKGFTGDPSQQPTVYYQNPSHHGRVTQAHKTATNVGHDFPSSNTGYSAQNEMAHHSDGSVRPTLIERQDGVQVHKSRNALVHTNTPTQQRTMHAQTQGVGFKAKDASVAGRQEYFREKAAQKKK